ncbi:MAG: hypothetical protein AAF492_05505, partial [Verrucomicrobiota bacterium]
MRLRKYKTIFIFGCLAGVAAADVSTLRTALDGLKPGDTWRIEGVWHEPVRLSRSGTRDDPNRLVPGSGAGKTNRFM